MLSRHTLHLFVLGTVILLLAFPRPVGAHSTAYTVEDTYHALDAVAATSGVSWVTLHRIVACESRLYPYAVGRAGELGVAQLHPRGELRTFRAYGYTDPFNPYDAIEFLALRLQQGGARAWSCR